MGKRLLMAVIVGALNALLWWGIDAMSSDAAHQYHTVFICTAFGYWVGSIPKEVI